MLKQLFLWRHAQAHPGSPDLQRTLTEHGRAQADQMARWLVGHCPVDTKLVCSPALRSQQTGAALVRIAPFVIHTETVLQPAAYASEVTDWLQAAPLAATAMVVVGHQPWIGQVAAQMLTGQPVDIAVKKSAIWAFERDDIDDAWSLRAVLSPQWLTD
jgi:phosphohistidine phosphatase